MNNNDLLNCDRTYCASYIFDVPDSEEKITEFCIMLDQKFEYYFGGKYGIFFYSEPKKVSFECEVWEGLEALISKLRWPIEFNRKKQTWIFDGENWKKG